MSPSTDPFAWLAGVAGLTAGAVVLAVIAVASCRAALAWDRRRRAQLEPTRQGSLVERLELDVGDVVWWWPDRP